MIVLLMLVWWGAPRVKSLECAKVLPSGEHWCIVTLTKPVKQNTVLAGCRADGEGVMFTIPAGGREAGLPVKSGLVRVEIGKYGTVPKCTAN
jgi:hypothetical protein